MESLLVIDLTFSAILMAISSPSIAQDRPLKKITALLICYNSKVSDWHTIFRKITKWNGSKSTLGKNLCFGYSFENFSPSHLKIPGNLTII